MSTKTQPKVIELVKIKSWYIPRNAESYQLLRSLGVPLVLIHKDFLSTLGLVTGRHNVRATETLWSKLFEDSMNKIGGQWKSHADRSCRLSQDKLVFLSKATERNRQAIAKLDLALQSFFARWGFRYRPTFSETLDRYKLVVDFRFDPELSPCIPSQVKEPKSEYELILGFTKIKLTFYDKPTEETKARALLAPLVIVETYTQTGTEWTVTHTGTFKDSQIGDPTQFMSALALLHCRHSIRV